MTACAKCGHDPEARVLASWSFTIPREIKSGNARVVNAGGTRWAYGEARRAWMSDVERLRMVHRIPEAQRKRRVTLTRIIGHGQREYDRDNLAPGFKALVDAMVRCELLVDDKPRHVELHFGQERRRGEYGVHVLIEELA